MNRLIRFIGFAAFLIMLFPPAGHTIDRTQCKQYGGTNDCWGPVLERWDHDVCGEVGAFNSYDIAV